MKSATAGLLGACCAGLIVIAPASGAGGEDPAIDSAPSSTLDLTYNLYVGGIPLGKVAMSARFQGNDYKAISSLETKGVVNAFWQSKIETASSGSATKDKLRPSLYDSFPRTVRFNDSMRR